MWRRKICDAIWNTRIYYIKKKISLVFSAPLWLSSIFENKTKNKKIPTRTVIRVNVPQKSKPLLFLSK